MIVTKMNPMLRPFFVHLDSRCFQVGKIVIFRDGEILLETSAGWFEPHPPESPEPYSLQTGEIHVARQVDLTREDNFLVKLEKDFLSQEARYVLYLNAREVEVERLGEKLLSEDQMRRVFGEAARLTFRVPAKTWAGDTLLEMVTAKFSRSEPTEFGRLLQKTSQELEGKGIFLETPQLTKLLTEYDLVPKSKRNDLIALAQDGGVASLCPKCAEVFGIRAHDFSTGPLKVGQMFLIAELRPMPGTKDPARCYKCGAVAEYGLYEERE